MSSAPDQRARYERKAMRLGMEACKESTLLEISLAIGRLKMMSDEDDEIGAVDAGTINGLILSMEACLSAIRAHIKV